jgi:hypothetical protein
MIKFYSDYTYTRDNRRFYRWEFKEDPRDGKMSVMGDKDDRIEGAYFSLTISDALIDRVTNNDLLGGDLVTQLEFISWGHIEKSEIQYEE